MDSIDPAATAWLLASTALVLLMTPGLAIFYGGMVRTTGVLNMIMMSFIAIPLVTVAWLLVGYTLAFSGDVGGGLIGDLTHVGMLGIGPGTAHGAVPELLYATFQLSFAIITAALVSGAIADRARFAAWMVFVPVWSIVVYSVVAHWVWAPDGWLFKLGVLDYAGGLVVEIVSPSTQRHDRLRKLSLYAHSGVAEYWLVTPHPFLVEVLRNVNGSFSIAQVCNEHDTLKSPAFPDLSLDLAELFAQLPPQPPIEEVRESTPPPAVRLG